MHFQVKHQVMLFLVQAYYQFALNDMSVANWVVENKFGVNALATEAELVKTYFSIEKETIKLAIFNSEIMKKKLGIPSFVK